MTNTKVFWILTILALYLQLHSGSPIDYESWTSFEEMYCYVIQISFDVSKNALSPQTPSRTNFRLPPIDSISLNGDVMN